MSAGRGKKPRPDVVFHLDAEDFYGMLGGRENLELLYMEDRIRVEGPMAIALKLRVLFMSGTPRLMSDERR